MSIAFLPFKHKGTSPCSGRSRYRRDCTPHAHIPRVTRVSQSFYANGTCRVCDRVRFCGWVICVASTCTVFINVRISSCTWANWHNANRLSHSSRIPLWIQSPRIHCCEWISSLYVQYRLFVNVNSYRSPAWYVNSVCDQYISCLW